MIVGIYRLLCLFVFVTAFGLSAWGGTPPEILEPYRSYQSALEQGNSEAAREFAYTAWKKSEDLLGDHKTTGDLAFNFAALASPLPGSNSLVRKRRHSAFKRAIELAETDNENGAASELERRVAHIEFMLSESRIPGETKYTGRSIKAIETLGDVLVEYGQEDSVFAADKNALQAQYYIQSRNPASAIEAAETARRLYDNLPDDVESSYKQSLPLTLGSLYLARERALDAALELQRIIQDPIHAHEESRLFQTAKTFWLKAWLQLDAKDAIEQAREQGLCDCIDKVHTGGPSAPLIRIPPIFPAQAKRSGEVIVRFDLDPNGRPINADIAATTDPIFSKAVLGSVKDWRYLKMRPDAPSESRTNIFVRVVFELRDGKGKLMKPEKLNMKINLPEDQQFVRDDRSIVVSASRVRIR